MRVKMTIELNNGKKYIYVTSYSRARLFIKNLEDKKAFSFRGKMFELDSVKEIICKEVSLCELKSRLR